MNTSHATMQEKVEKDIVGTCSVDAGTQGGNTEGKKEKEACTVGPLVAMEEQLTGGMGDGVVSMVIEGGVGVVHERLGGTIRKWKRQAHGSTKVGLDQCCRIKQIRRGKIVMIQ